MRMNAFNIWDIRYRNPISSGIQGCHGNRNYGRGIGNEFSLENGYMTLLGITHGYSSTSQFLNQQTNKLET